MELTQNPPSMALDELVETPVSSAGPSAFHVATPTDGRFPRWLRVVDSIHRGVRAPYAVMLDLAVLAAAGLTVGARLSVLGAMVPALLFILYVCNIYSDRSPIDAQGVMWFATSITAPIAITTLSATAVLHALGNPVGDALWIGVASLLGLVAVRAGSWVVLAWARRKGLGLRRTLIVGNSKIASKLARTLNEFPEAGLLPVSMLPTANGHGFARFAPAFPTAPQLARTIDEAQAGHVVLVPNDGDDPILECVRGSDLAVEFSMLPPISELFLHPRMMTQVGGIPLIPLGKIARRRTTLPGKRIFDLALTSLLFIALAPLLALTAISIAIFAGRPILYRQRRVGRHGKVFAMLKFRSMVVDADRLVIDLRDQNVNNGLLFKVQNDPRITTIGRIIRRLSIDELPQLWNVIKGEMSLVGPRPLPVEPEDFDPLAHRRHDVRPGITGLWQVRGGNALSYEDMIELDLSYIASWSLTNDVRLLLKTLPAILVRRAPI
jgi:exopolysaccharide biosynthesis polyprenyl glycosylphosphotransferase